MALLMHAMKPDTDLYENFHRQQFIQRNPYLENEKHKKNVILKKPTRQLDG